MNYLVAVSGGIDSVVLLDMLAKNTTISQNTSFQGVPLENTRRKPSFSGRGKLWDSFPKRSGGQRPPIIVAHFDHGIRPDSAADARFVEALAARYHLPYVGKREELGKDASEEFARSRRYRFLGEEALLRQAKIVTAHHQDDALETIAINLTRGTGWRGLAVLGGEHIVRPLLGRRKEEIREYALSRRLEWVEDSTNAEDAYLRNRLRRRLHRTLDPNVQQQVMDLWEKQLAIRREIEEEGRSFMTMGPQSRYFFTHIPETVAAELLRAYFESCFNWSPTRPQLERALLAIKTARPGTRFPFGAAELRVDKKDFKLSVKTP